MSAHIDAVWSRGVPYCGIECRSLVDGERCIILGESPTRLCAPAVDEMARRLEKLERLAVER